MQRFVRIGATAVLVFFGVFVATAFAAGEVTPESGSLFDALRPVVDAFTKGQYLYAGMLALVLAVAMLKRYAPKQYGISAWVHGDVGGSVLTLVASFAGAVASALGAGTGMSWALAKTAMMIAVGAAGGYSLIKRLIVTPLLRPLAAKAPAWSQPIFSLIFWIFDKPTPVETAEAAGDAAVAAKPAAGLEGVVGKAQDVE